MTATLCGSEQLKPAQPIARAPLTAVAEVGGGDLTIDVAGVEAGRAIRRLDHHHRRIPAGGR